MNATYVKMEDNSVFTGSMVMIKENSIGRYGLSYLVAQTRQFYIHRPVYTQLLFKKKKKMNGIVKKKLAGVVPSDA